MANGLQDSINKLEASIRHVGARVMSLPIARSNSKLESLLSLPSVKKRIGMIQSQDRIEQILSIKKRSSRLFAADAWMEANPGNRFGSANAKVRYDDLMAKRRKREYDANMIFKRDLMSIENPNQYEKEVLKEKYGFTSVGGEDAAQQIRDAKASDLRKKRRKRDRMDSIAADESFKFTMLDSDEQFIQSRMKQNGWTRNQAEQVYFKEITKNAKWLRIIAKGNPIIAKNLIPIAKAVGKASGLPIIGAFAKNPMLGAISAIIGGGLAAGSYSLGRSNTLAKWMNARAVTGDIGLGTFSGLAATGMSYEQMLQSLAKYSVKSSGARFGEGYEKYGELTKYGVDVSGLFNPFLTAEERRAEEYRVVSSADQADRAAIMSRLEMSPEEFRAEQLKNTPRSKWSVSDLQLDIYQGVTKKMKEDYPVLDFIIPDKFYQLHSLLAAKKEKEDREFFGDKVVDARNEVYNLHKWDEVRDTAMVDDQYRAGMFDNSVTNNETNNGKSLTVINNWGGVSVEASDPVGLAEGLEAGVGNKFIGSREVAEWFDTKAVK